MIQRIMISLLLVWFPQCLLAAQSAVTITEASLHDSANSSATPVSVLSKDTPLTVLKRKGGWYFVETESQQQGWLRMLKVRFLSEQEANEKSIAEILSETAAMPPASGITTGVRGVSGEALGAAGDDSETLLKQIQNYVPTEEAVTEFAGEGRLEAHDSIDIPTE